MSSSSSFESPINFFRRNPILDHCCQSCLMKSKLSQFEEKFKLRESILIGCDTVTDLADKVPFLSDMRLYAEFIHERAMQGKPQDVCVQWGSNEEELITEYVKTFIKISDAWLSLRNCFGQDGCCMKKNCCLDVKDLSSHYVDWMHSSRQLLHSIGLGLKRVNVTCKRNSGVQLYPPERDGLRGYPPNPPCPRPLKSDTKTHCPEPTGRFNPPPPLYPGPPPGFTNMEVSTGGAGYMTPSSYDVPRNNLSDSFRRNNIGVAKSNIYRDSSISRSFVVKFIISTGREHEGEMPHKTLSDVGSKKEKEFPDSKSDSESQFRGKDCRKKFLKKTWQKRRRDPQSDSMQDLFQGPGQLKVSSEKPLEHEVTP